MAYASWYHWNCGRTQRKAATINQFACPSYSLYVQLLWYPMYYPEGMKARVSPVQWSKPYSILAPLRIRTRAAGFRIISGDHYTTTAHLELWYIGCWVQFPPINIWELRKGSLLQYCRYQNFKSKNNVIKWMYRREDATLDTSFLLFRNIFWCTWNNAICGWDSPLELQWWIGKFTESFHHMLINAFLHWLASCGKELVSKKRKHYLC